MPKMLKVTGCCACGKDHDKLVVFEIPAEVDTIVDTIPSDWTKFVVCPTKGLVVFYNDSIIAIGYN